MGNAYWAGSLPGLILATISGVGLVRLLDPPGRRHVVWIVPALHFAGAFAVGPALSILFGYVAQWLPGGAGTWAWVIGFPLAGLTVGAIGARAASHRQTWRMATFVVSFTAVGVLIPAFYLLVAA